jgi:hypothetical protein
MKQKKDGNINKAYDVRPSKLQYKIFENTCSQSALNKRSCKSLA